MTPTSMGPLLRHLRNIPDESKAPGVRDEELLKRFLGQRDEVAFELLVWRHQRMVLGVCRRVLGNTHDAEDAFQATFLTLVRKAASVSRRDAVASWLHTVAHRIALRVRAATVKRAKPLVNLDTIACVQNAEEDLRRRDLAAVVDEEVSRLPAKYRVAMILCYLEGKTYQEASRQLGLPLGTLSARLTRARSLLRTRLIRRGVDISAALLGTLLCEQAASATAPAALVNTTIRSATAMVTGQAASAISPSVVTLMDGVLRSMCLYKLKIVAVGSLAGLLVTGMGLFIPAALISPAVESEPLPQATPPAEANTVVVRVDRQGDPLPAGALFRFGSVRLRHDSSIRASALSPDGKILATTSSGRSVVLWDLVAGKPMRRFVCDQHWPYTFPGIAFSPDGMYLGYAQSNDFACVWDVRSGQEVFRLEGDKEKLHRLCRFSSDSKEFILNDDRRVNFWNVHSKREVHSIRAENVSLLSPDAGTLVRIEREAIHFNNVQTGEEFGRWDLALMSDGFENGIAFAPDVKTLGVVYQRKELQIRDFPGGKVQASFAMPESAKYRVSNRDYWGYRVSFSADGQTLLLGTKGGLVHRWDLATRTELPPLQKHFGAVNGVHTLPDGKTIVTTGEDGLIRRWDRQTGRELDEPPGYMGRTHAAYSPDGRSVVLGDARGRLDLWDARKGRPLRTLQHEGPAITKLAFTPKGQLLAVARADNSVHLWTVATGEEPRILHCDKEHDLAYVWNMRFSPDGRRLLIMDHNYRARLWELSSGKVCWRNTFGAAEFSSDGETLAMVYVGPYLNLLDASSGKSRARLRLSLNSSEGLGRAPAMAFSPDGRRIALAMEGVYVCDARSGAEIHHFQAADQLKGLPAFVRRQALITGEGGVHGLAFSPDGKWLCTSGRDGSVRLWEVVTGREVLRLNGHAGDVQQLTFGADSRTVLSCGEDTQAYLWSLQPASEKAKAELESLWSALAGEPAKAYRAIWAMSEIREATAFLRSKLKPTEPVTNERLARLIADLDSDQFAVREAASKALAGLDALAAPAMRAALRNNPPLEMRKRLEESLHGVESTTLSFKDLRTWRAIDVLERLGTAEARKLLRVLAEGAPEALTTTAAQAALKRLQR